MNDIRILEDESASAFVHQECLPYLRQSQNIDGGWGFLAGKDSRVEPTAWATLALSEYCQGNEIQDALSKAIGFFQNVQLADGSWAASPSQLCGSWVTSLACWALLASGTETENFTAGLRWLQEDRPGDSGRWWRMLRRLAGSRNISGQSDSYYGWSWTPGTASWVEPTSYALLVLRSLPEAALSIEMQSRIRIAKQMLYDRMCPGGGWNCGNPMVYGVAGEPQVTPTAFALLALLESSSRSEIEESLNWLEKHSVTVASPTSNALSNIVLHVFGRQIATPAHALSHNRVQDDIAWSIPEAGWVALSLSSKQHWLNLKCSRVRL